MKDLQLLTWLTQLGLSTAVPLAGFVLLGVWLRNRFSLGNWVLLAGVALGIICAVDGLRVSLKMMGRMANDKEKQPPCAGFNDHD